MHFNKKLLTVCPSPVVLRIYGLFISVCFWTLLAMFCNWFVIWHGPELPYNSLHLTDYVHSWRAEPSWRVKGLYSVVLCPSSLPDPHSSSVCHIVLYVYCKMTYIFYIISKCLCCIWYINTVFEQRWMLNLHVSTFTISWLSVFFLHSFFTVFLLKHQQIISSLPDIPDGSTGWQEQSAAKHVIWCKDAYDCERWRYYTFIHRFAVGLICAKAWFYFDIQLPITRREMRCTQFEGTKSEWKSM